MSIEDDLSIAVDSANQRAMAEGLAWYDFILPSQVPPAMNNPYSTISPVNDPIQAVSGLPQWGSLGTTSNKWYGFVSHPNGKLYGVPYNATQVLEFDPIAKTTVLFGSAGSGTTKYMGGVVGQDGKIYCIPFNANTILVIDPINRTTSSWGSLSGSNKWVGGVPLPDGRIMGIPYNSNSYLMATPGAQLPVTYSGASGGNAKFFGGVLFGAEVFMGPFNNPFIRAYNYNNYNRRDFSVSGAVAGGWAGGCLTKSSTILFAPYNASTVLELNPATGQVSQYVFADGGVSAKYVGFHMAPNGKAYAIPHSAAQVLEFDPISKRITLLPVKSGANKWAGGGLARDGKIYGCPRNDSRILEIGIGARGSDWWALSAYVNKL